MRKKRAQDVAVELLPSTDKVRLLQWLHYHRWVAAGLFFHAALTTAQSNPDPYAQSRKHAASRTTEQNDAEHHNDHCRRSEDVAVWAWKSGGKSVRDRTAQPSEAQHVLLGSRYRWLTRN